MKVMVTMAKNNYKKKLTNSGGGVCFMTCIAALFALCGAAGDLLAGLLYTQFFSRQIYDMTPNPIDFVYDGSANIATAVFALVMMFWAFSAAKAKRMGREFGWVNIFMSLALCISPAVKLYRLLGTDFFDKWETRQLSTYYEREKKMAEDSVAGGLYGSVKLLLA